MSKVSIEQVKEIIENRVKGVWKPEHDEYGHHYRHRDSGVLVDSVTTQLILDKPHITPWAVEIGIRHFIGNIDFYDPKNEEQTQRMIETSKFAFRGVRDDAGNVGTRSHDVIERYINEWIETGKRREDIRTLIDPSEDHRVFATARSAERFFNEHPGITPIASELLVGSEVVQAAGTLDFLVMWDGQLWILDWKTSNSAVHEEYAIQVATYKKLFEHMTGLKVAGCTVIGISKKYDTYTALDVASPYQAYLAFLGVSKTYRWKKNGKDKLLSRKKRITI